MASLKTQGTHLFVINTSTGTSSVMKITCPTGITGVTSGARSQIDVTCLDATDDMVYAGGLGSPGTVSVPFILDPQEASHQALFDLKTTGDKVQWLIGLSDGVAPPTIDVDNEFVLPTDRSTIEFTAYVADLDIDISTNEVVRGTLTLQRSGAYTFTPKTVV